MKKGQKKEQALCIRRSHGSLRMDFDRFGFNTILRDEGDQRPGLVLAGRRDPKNDEDTPQNLSKVG